VRRPLVAAPAYLDRHGRPQHPRDLESHQALIYTNTRSPRLWRVSRAGEGDYLAPVSGRLAANNGDALEAALVAGQGIALLPEFMVWRELASGALEEVLPAWSAPSLSLHLVTPPGVERPARVALLIDFLARRLAAAPWAKEAVVP
jgi:DNA-binding transcriptional LysR family regulator